MNRIKKIFVPTDYSPCSKTAVSYAAFLAERLNAAVLLAHIFEPLGYPIDFAMTYWSEFDLKKMSQALERVAHSLRQDGLSVETHFFHGDPATQIVKQAEHLDSDLIVMGTHGRTGITHLMIGSVAERVVQTSKVPVLTVRQQDKKMAEKAPRKEAVPKAS